MSSADSPLDSEKLLDRLFDRGVLPRYAFPTDVVTFSVFDRERGTPWRPVLRYTPQASGSRPGAERVRPQAAVWIDGLKHWSLSLWTPFPRDLAAAYAQQRVYFECDPGAAMHELEELTTAENQPGMVRDCSACGTPLRWGPP